ncbi:heptaprenyl diphosphate synthase component 1 [Paenibacillus gansuensis]|uniref:Heptaprenyl diphosphate synthase component 1 n=1 Tax=Paenibacillus gansuensis TaxID=306542 RepID=A0ABW5PBQ7_9BACL
MNTYRIPDLAKKFTEHDMIVQHTDLPETPDFRIKLLHTFLSGDAAKDPENSEVYSLAVMLVQLGLDTHDQIDTDQGSPQEGDRSRQLKVLAGDYFSSGFYHLLSKAGHIEAVTSLSAAICEINRMKMQLYLRMKQWKMTADEYLQHTVGIKTQLFLSFAKKMNGVSALRWPELLQAFTRCEVLVQEMESSELQDPARRNWAYWHVWERATKEEKQQLKDGLDRAGWLAVLKKYNVKNALLELLQSQLQQAGALIAQFDSDKLRQELGQLGEPFKRYVSSPVLEEI